MSQLRDGSRRRGRPAGHQHQHLHRAHFTTREQHGSTCPIEHTHHPKRRISLRSRSLGARAGTSSRIACARIGGSSIGRGTCAGFLGHAIDA